MDGPLPYLDLFLSGISFDVCWVKVLYIDMVHLLNFSELEGQTSLFPKKMPLLLRTAETHKCFPNNSGALSFWEKTNFAFF